MLRNVPTHPICSLCSHRASSYAMPPHREQSEKFLEPSITHNTTLRSLSLHDATASHHSELLLLYRVM
jgi:hypothetical protein